MTVEDVQALLGSIDQLKQYIDQREKIWESGQNVVNSDGDAKNMNMKAEDVQSLIDAIDQLKRYIDQIEGGKADGVGQGDKQSQQFGMQLDDVQTLLDSIE